MEIFTIGFTKRSAADFFGALRSNGVRLLLDIRLRNSSQLAAFAKRDDLAFFLRELGGIAYRHEMLLAPSADLLDAYRKKRISWDRYAEGFRELMAARQVESVIDASLFGEPTVLLCSEPRPEKCHRRLVIDYLAEKWGEVRPVHL